MANVAALRTAQTLGVLGLLPFSALALLTWLPESATLGQRAIVPLAQWALVAYAALILSFLGAVHWGFVLRAPSMPPRLMRQSLAWGVIPSLLCWLALAFAFLIADLVLVRVMDGALLRESAVPANGYLELRTRLTVGASLALAVALAASL
jgi:hypothetical protein